MGPSAHLSVLTCPSAISVSGRASSTNPVEVLQFPGGDKGHVSPGCNCRADEVFHTPLLQASQQSGNTMASGCTGHSGPRLPRSCPRRWYCLLPCLCTGPVSESEPTALMYSPPCSLWCHNLPARVEPAEGKHVDMPS